MDDIFKHKRLNMQTEQWTNINKVLYNNRTLTHNWQQLAWKPNYSLCTTCPGSALVSVVQLVGVWSHRPKGHRLHSQSGHVPEFWVPFPVKHEWEGNQLMLLSQIDVSLSLSLSASLPFSLSLPFLSRSSEGISLGEYKIMMTMMVIVIIIKCPGSQTTISIAMDPFWETLT